jgi:hypothetical protein
MRLLRPRNTTTIDAAFLKIVEQKDYVISPPIKENQYATA